MYLGHIPSYLEQTIHVIPVFSSFVIAVDTLLELSSTDPIIRMTDSNGVANKSIYEMRAIGASGSESLEFRSVNDANTSYNKLLVLKHGGNVGIGTDSPSNGKLQIDSSTNQISIETTDIFRTGVQYNSSINLEYNNSKTIEFEFEDRLKVERITELIVPKEDLTYSKRLI